MRQAEKRGDDFILSCFKGKFKVTSIYGTRKLNGKTAMHNGLDLVGIEDVNVYAPCDGVVGASRIVTDKKNLTWQWGNYVRIDTKDGFCVYLCHLKSRSVKTGQSVKKGDKIGVMGNTGYSFGAHTHFEVRNAKTNKAVNPSEWSGIPNKAGVYVAETVLKTDLKTNSNGGRQMLESGNDIVWQLMNGKNKIKIDEPKRAVEALDKAKTDKEFCSLYWIIYKLVNT